MPELPEVETIRAQLEKYLIGHIVEKTKVNHRGVLTSGEKKLEGGKVRSIKRFGKVLSIDLDNDYSAVIHIKLTGQLIYRGPNLRAEKLSEKVAGGVAGKHTHVVFSLDRGGVLYYNDVRRFGWIKVIKTAGVENVDFISKLGPEPLGKLTKEKFEEVLGSTRRAIKTLLLDQSKLSGVGNIYANDALWLSKIHPAREANSLTSQEAGKLFHAVEKVLKEGLKRGGASELSFVTPDGGEGSYQEHFLAYGQEGELCSRCKKSKIEKVKLSGRGTFFCPICQKREKKD